MRCIQSNVELNRISTERVRSLDTDEVRALDAAWLSSGSQVPSRPAPHHTASPRHAPTGPDSSEQREDFLTSN